MLIQYIFLHPCFLDHLCVAAKFLVIDAEGLEESLGHGFFLLNLLLLQTRNGHKGMNGWPRREVPVHVELEGPVGLQLVRHQFLDRAGRHAKVSQICITKRFICQL